ncbi:glycosyltransferase [Flavobacterium columnare]|uniref:Glycosyltransferase n=1 Tax=Flavobacterium columnare TaxID=996 RepID=A0AA94JNE8_9FLAO|nr:glycosyltransferase [Flavobacterium columnare]MCH4829009.1 glycosyltransferase [Flavobacterium columnare]MCH4833783.1 glycosyltransferase [Flavobacterium columnare]
MRIVQLIDTLEIGGAERMAVNYANALSKTVEFSGLIATRSEGLLKEQIIKNVNYLFIDRKKVLDFKPYLSSRNYLIKNRITHIQAHSSSFFWAVLLKLTVPKIKIIWHDHYGFSENIEERSFLLLKYFSCFFTSIISVNKKLESWAKYKLLCKKNIYIPNFFDWKFTNEVVNLRGKKGKRILHLANLRPQKNHEFLLKIAKEIVLLHPDWSFHLVGQDTNDEYSKSIKEKIVDYNLNNNIFIYGGLSNVAEVISGCDIGILTSISEGLPVALLEYGAGGLPTVTTDVGEIPNFFNEKFGAIIKVTETAEFIKELNDLIQDGDKRLEKGLAFQKFVNEFFNESEVIKKFIEFCK